MNEAPKLHLEETMKGFSDYFKHITTLDTGAILIIIAFIEKAFKRPEARGLIAIAFVCFASSLVCSVVAIYGYAKRIAAEEQKIHIEYSNFRKALAKVNFSISILGFIFGVLSLVIFGIVNILGGSSGQRYY